MDEARRRADMLGQIGQERDHVMLGDRLDLVDPGDLESALLPDLLGGLLGDDPELRLSVAGMGLDLEPDLEFHFRGPDGHHIGSGIARDH